MNRARLSLLTLGVAICAITPACFGLECAIPGFCAEGEGEGDVDTDLDGDPVFELCDVDGACFVCGAEASLAVTPNGSGCEGAIVCENIEFRMVCDIAVIGADVVETCVCQVDREPQTTFEPTELCEANNRDARALTECGWTLQER